MAIPTMPEDILLAETHEYILVEEDRARVGISNFAAEQLGDVVFVELPEVGDVFEKGESFGSVESVKAASDLYMPVSGEVVAVNGALEDEPGTVNDDPYGSGWIIEINVTNPADLKDLMSPEAYSKFVDANS
jgi:glycine cleavage system H protein